MSPEPIAAIGVVIPAYNEADLIAGCLASIREAAARIATPLHVVVVDDGSEDATVAIAQAELEGLPGTIARGRGKNVGAARSLGIETVFARYAGLPHSRIWLATTDADSSVPPDWLAYQLECANAGADALAGLIDISSHPAIHRIFEPLYRLGIGSGTHTHIHGANMAMRASVYRAAGGFRADGCHEDVLLWRRISALPGVNAIADPRLVVRTSARTVSRVEGGFATYISNMSAAS